MSEDDYKTYEERVNAEAGENPDDYAEGDPYPEDEYEQLEDPDEAFSLDGLPTDDEVLKLTEYDGNLTIGQGTGVVAEYRDINIEAVDKRHAIQAKNLVTRITKFVLEFNDVELSDAHKSYIKDVAKIELENLQDMMGLVTVNKEMLNNIVRRVNATQAEDYAIIGTYNNLVSLQMRLMKELQNTYRSLPGMLKKMRADIVCDQQLEERTPGGISEDGEPITEHFGDTQFNNTKHLLKTLRARHEEKRAQGGNAA